VSDDLILQDPVELLNQLLSAASQEAPISIMEDDLLEDLDAWKALTRNEAFKSLWNELQRQIDAAGEELQFANNMVHVARLQGRLQTLHRLYHAPFDILRSLEEKEGETRRTARQISEEGKHNA
jgi:hypothetical protein